MSSMSDIQIVECEMRPTERAEKVADFLRRFGDDLPEESIQKAVNPENLGNVKTICDDEGEIISMALWERADWYLCTIKNVATDPRARRMGLGSKVTKKAIDGAIENGCLVLTADITATNEPSKNMFRKQGFKEINQFCWAEGEEPADILHYVLMPPDDQGQCVRQ